MFFPPRNIVERIKKEYPSGTRVELIELNDPYRHFDAGLKGTVSCVDDTGTTRIGKYIFNHSFLVIGLLMIFFSVLLGFIVAPVAINIFGTV